MIADADFEGAGAAVGSRTDVLKGAQAILCVLGPEPASLAGAEPGALLIGALDPLGRRDAIDAYAKAGLDALAMEWMPRISRAQSMDVLSSQSNLAGYKAVIEAADAFGRAFPMMMTAAGTISPAKVFVMVSASPALQAIATARGWAPGPCDRCPLGNPRANTSLGAKPVFVEMSAGIEGEGAGGYATEMSAEYQKLRPSSSPAHIAKQDIVVTTALIPWSRRPG